MQHDNARWKTDPEIGRRALEAAKRLDVPIKADQIRTDYVRSRPKLHLVFRESKKQSQANFRGPLRPPIGQGGATPPK